MIWANIAKWIRPWYLRWLPKMGYLIESDHLVMGDILKAKGDLVVMGRLVLLNDALMLVSGELVVNGKIIHYPCIPKFDIRFDTEKFIVAIKRAQSAANAMAAAFMKLSNTKSVTVSSGDLEWVDRLER